MQSRAKSILAPLVILAFLPLTAFCQNLEIEKPRDALQMLLNEARYHESYGRNDLRNVLVQKAAELAGKNHPAVAAMQGKVRIGNEFKTPEEIAQVVGDNNVLKQYVALRERTADNFQGNVALAAHCRQAGLQTQQKAHLQRALDFAPDNEQVRHLLGHRQIEGRWLTPEQIENESRTLFLTQQRLRLWAPRIAAIRDQLKSPDRKVAKKAMKSLGDLEDSSCTTALELMLTNESPAIAEAVVEKLNSFLDSESTLALMRIALGNQWASVRQSATKALSKRDMYEYVPTLISMMSSPIFSRVQVIPGAHGQILYRHVYAQQKSDTNVIRQYDTVYQRISSGKTTGTSSLVSSMRDIRKNVRPNEQAKQSTNLEINWKNKRITEVLDGATGQNLGHDVKAWWNWWNSYNEVYVSQRSVSSRQFERSVAVVDRDMQPPTYQEMISEITRNLVQQSLARSRQQALKEQQRLASAWMKGRRIRRRLPRTSLNRGRCCLAAGTTVWTMRGPQSIEKVKIGDQVLSQNIETGELTYCSVTGTTIRPVTQTFKLVLEEDSLQASGGHPFWVAGKGWVTVREIKPGMVVSCVGRSQVVKSVKQDNLQLLYNLIVDGNSNYFIGKTKVLSHDNTLRSPARQLVPGLK